MFGIVDVIDEYILPSQCNASRQEYTTYSVWKSWRFTVKNDFLNLNKTKISGVRFKRKYCFSLSASKLYV